MKIAGAELMEEIRSGQVRVFVAGADRTKVTAEVVLFVRLHSRAYVSGKTRRLPWSNRR